MGILCFVVGQVTWIHRVFTNINIYVIMPPNGNEEVPIMQRGQRRSVQSPRAMQPQRVSQGRSAKYRRRRRRSKRPMIFAAVAAILIILIVVIIVSISGKSETPLSERIIGKWISDEGSTLEFHDTGAVDEYIPPQPELDLDAIIATLDWSLHGDVLTIGSVSAECTIDGDVLTWGKAEYSKSK